MATWNARHYLRFGDERTRPAVDLVARIDVEAPQEIVDLGCGPGNSTQVLRARWPGAIVRGIDNSPEMIDAARAAYPAQDWICADLSDWVPDRPVDLVFSNAALQWLGDHRRLLPRLFSAVAAGGAFGFQIPSNGDVGIRKLIQEIAEDPMWRDRMTVARSALTMEEPSVYYDLLAGQATAVDIWVTEYFHRLDSSDAIVDWMAGTGLRPFLEALDDANERQRFVRLLRAQVAAHYRPHPDGKILFPFRRTFVIAYPLSWGRAVTCGQGAGTPPTSGAGYHRPPPRR
ncbi:methyltransferase domain-containing protein [Candidatus Thiosymbion oneisti]|uniref:methyltransferase domain-containing protein n=1 Tax=Candidatus Thiosymbion oneisti TaxID=589554 RepID=UPI001061476A|nr:methyltransferase domain-containing protein [Candidatus Thiosymbion oneisti]